MGRDTVAAPGRARGAPCSGRFDRTIMPRLPGPLLHTERLYLQTARLRDVPELYTWTRDPQVHRYLAFDGPESPKQTMEFVRTTRREQRRGEALVYVIHEAGNRAAIGCCGAHHLDPACWYQAEIGYWLARPYWRRGYMHEALREFLAHLFGTIGLARLYAGVLPGNTASVGLLERLGFTYEATLRQHVRKQGRYTDLVQFSLLASDEAARPFVHGGA